MEQAKELVEYQVLFCFLLIVMMIPSKKIVMMICQTIPLFSVCVILCH